MSHHATFGSTAISVAPSATSMWIQKSPKPRARPPVAKRVLGGLVDSRHGSLIIFCAHGECAPEVAEGDPVADVRQLERQLKVVVQHFQTSTSNLSFASASERSCWRQLRSQHS